MGSKDELAVKSIYEQCNGEPNTLCETALNNYASRNDIPRIRIKKFFCDTHPGELFCQVSTIMPIQQSAAPAVPAAPAVQPQLTPEQLQQLQLQQQQQQQMKSMLTTPSGFISQNPGISIGFIVMLVSIFCFFAAFSFSFLTKKNEKSSDPIRGRRGNQMKKPPAFRNHQKKKKSSSVSKMEKGKKSQNGKLEEKNKDENEEKPKSNNSKSRGISEKSVDKTS